MKIIRTFSIALALFATVAHADTPAPKKEADPAAVKKFLAFFDKIVDAVVADKDNCPKMAKDINGLIDANKDLLEMAKKAEEEGKTLPDDAKKHMMESAKKMMPAMQKCSSDKDVTAAFGRLEVKKH